MQIAGTCEKVSETDKRILPWVPTGSLKSLDEPMPQLVRIYLATPLPLLSCAQPNPLVTPLYAQGT